LSVIIVSRPKANRSGRSRKSNIPANASRLNAVAIHDVLHAQATLTKRRPHTINVRARASDIFLVSATRVRDEVVPHTPAIDCRCRA
jgi:hypothetical protein